MCFLTSLQDAAHYQKQISTLFLPSAVAPMKINPPSTPSEQAHSVSTLQKFDYAPLVVADVRCSIPSPPQCM